MLVEEGLGEVLLDILVDVRVRREIGDVGFVNRASTSVQHPEDAAFPVEDDRA